VRRRLLPSVVLAHATGFSWDEALLVLSPLVLLAAALVLVKRRLDARNEELARGAGAQPSAPDTSSRTEGPATGP
jgi:hypothetical protein